MLPHEKALVERMKDKPFALIGVNSDVDEEKLRADLAKARGGDPKDVPPAALTSASCEQVRAILAKHGIAWRNAVDGSTDGPWATRWNVHGWPTIYVIDAKGVIRHRNVRDEAMEKAVVELLKEAGAG